MVTLSIVNFSICIASLVLYALLYDKMIRWIKAELPRKKLIVCVDFDGVIHDHRSWKNARSIEGEPVVGAIQWLNDLVEGAPANFTIAIFSTRNSAFGGARAIKKWLFLYGLSDETVKRISFPIIKPPAFVFIDDRAIPFFGVFPKFSTIKNFTPWNRKVF